MYTKFKVFAFFILISMNSHALLITGSFTGAWYNQEKPGQGYILQILDAKEGQNAMVFWFSFDSQGNQLWLYGLGPVDGDQVTMDLLHVEGGVLTPDGFDNENLTSNSWGTLTLSFQNCNKGTARYESLDESIGSGSNTIKRLSKTVGSNCSGGVSDNTSSDTEESNVHMDFTNTGVDEDASGNFKVEQNANFTKLKVWVKDLPAGTYDILIDGENRSTIVSDGRGQDHHFFSSPQLANWTLLDFEIMGKTIEISMDGVVYLTADIPE